MTDTNKTSGADVLAAIDRLAELERDIRSGSKSKVYCEIVDIRAAVAALIEREAAQASRLTIMRRILMHAAGPSEPCSEYEAAERACYKIASLTAERDALAAEVKALREDAERLDWLDSQEADVRFHRDHELAGDGEYLIMVQIVNGDKSISGHPLGYVRDAIDAARASAATGGGNA